MTVIYLDILFLCNLTFDLLSIYLTSRFTNTNLCPFRSFLGCVLASGVSIWLLLWCSNGILFFGVALLMLALMVLLSFSIRSMGGFFRLTVVLLFCLFLTGALAYYLLWLAIERFGIHEAIGGDAKGLLFSAISIFSGGLLALTSHAVKRQNAKKTVKIKVEWENRTATATCLVDSGNLLKDPIDGRPVLLLPRAIGKQLFTEQGLFEAMLNPEKGSADLLGQSPLGCRIRLVPFRTISHTGVLLCVIPKRLLLEDLEIKALVGICPLENSQNLGICPQCLLS